MRSQDSFLSRAIPCLVIDARMLRVASHGIAAYVIAIAEALKSILLTRHLSYKVVFLVHSPPKAVLKLLKPFEVQHTKSAFLSPFEIFEIPWLLKKLKTDLYHSPSFSSLLYCPSHSVVTLHDLNHLHFGGWLKKLYYKTAVRFFASRALEVLTVSECSKQEILKWLKLPPTQVTVILNAIPRIENLNQDPSCPTALTSEEALASVLFKKYQLHSKQYFFCLSNLKPHKNLKTLFEAYRLLQSEVKNLWPLVVNVPEEPSSSSSPPPQTLNIKRVGVLSESCKKLLLRSAGGFVFPSLYEGFGLPPVEAILEGVPLAVSQIAAHEEALQDLDPSELYWVVEPQSVKQWQLALKKLFENKVNAPFQSVPSSSSLSE